MVTFKGRVERVILYTTHSLKQCGTITHSLKKKKQTHINTRKREKSSNTKAHHNFTQKPW